VDASTTDDDDDLVEKEFIIKLQMRQYQMRAKYNTREEYANDLL
jgi:hypothetical protein